MRRYDLLERNPLKSEHDYSDAPNVTHLTDYKAAAISYIAGYVVKMANKQLYCMQCANALGSKSHPAYSDFMAMKDRGGLFKPTTSVIKVCEETEKCFNRMLASTGGSLPYSIGNNSEPRSYIQPVITEKIWCICLHCIF